MSIASVEELVEEHWRTRELTDEQISGVRQEVLEHLDMVLPDRDKRIQAAKRAVTTLTDERDVLLRAHYAGAVPLDQLRAEQDRIGRALAAAEREITQHEKGREQLVAGLDRALNIIRDAYDAYKRIGATERRAMNQAVFDRLVHARRRNRGCPTHRAL